MEKKESMSSELFNALGADHIHETDDCNLCTMSRVMQEIRFLVVSKKIKKTPLKSCQFGGFFLKKRMCIPAKLLFKFFKKLK